MYATRDTAKTVRGVPPSALAPYLRPVVVCKGHVQGLKMEQEVVRPAPVMAKLLAPVATPIFLQLPPEQQTLIK